MILEYGDQLVAQPKKVKASYINFAKAPKKVDIKKLKSNLWQNIESIATSESVSFDTIFL
jgi:condensin complex subunit 2